MDADEALRFVEDLLRERGDKPLNDLQRVVFRGSWLGKDYKEIHQECAHIGRDHLMRNVGPRLWKLLSEVISHFAGEAIAIRKDALRGPIEDLHHSQTNPGSSMAPEREDEWPEPGEFEDLWLPTEPGKWDWEQAPDASRVYGRNRELEEIQRWIEVDGCRVVTLYGTAGIGKTALSVKIAEQLRDRSFQFVIWRSLACSAMQQSPPLITDLFSDLIQFFSDQQDPRCDLVTLLAYLRDHRCLIVLDGLESVFQSGSLSGQYAEDYEAYGDFLRRVSESEHQSCLILTSREKPKSLDRLEGAHRPVRSQRVYGLRATDAMQLFAEREPFTASEADWQRLFWQYDGNPFFLQQVATTIAHAFGGDVASFLNYRKDRVVLVGDIRQVLEQQMSRLSHSEIMVIHALARHDQPATLEEIVQVVGSVIVPEQLLDALLSLVRRSLLEINAGVYSLPPLIAGYASENLVAS